MKQKKAGIIFGAVVFLLMTMTTVVIADGQQNTHIYTIPETSDIGIGAAINVQLTCNTPQPVSIWCIEWLNFTKGVVDCIGIERGTFFGQSQSGDNTYYRAWSLNDTAGLYGLTSSVADADPPAEQPAAPAPAPAPVQPAVIPQNTGSTGGSYAGGASSGAGTTITRNSTPGFELLVFIGSIGAVFALLRKKR